MLWSLSHRFDSRACKLADRHYSRQTNGSPQYAPPGKLLALFRETPNGSAVWATSWQKREYTRHQWPGYWNCSIFRNEGAGLSSLLILDALAATRWKWPAGQRYGMITFVDPGKIKKKRDPGRCFRRAGFIERGFTKKGLLVLGIALMDMPTARPPTGAQLLLF